MNWYVALLYKIFNVFTLIVFVKSDRKKNELLVFWYCYSFAIAKWLRLAGLYETPS